MITATLEIASEAGVLDHIERILRRLRQVKTVVECCTRYRKTVNTPFVTIPRLKTGASRSSPTECTRRGSFTKAPSEPTVIAISVGGLWLLNPTSSIGTRSG